jgi:hypothetical protein
MKTTKLSTNFGPEAQFDVFSGYSVSMWDKVRISFHRLFDRALHEADDGNVPGVEDAAKDAAALAFATGMPLLFFPVIFEEKLSALRSAAKRPHELRPHIPVSLAA